MKLVAVTANVAGLQRPGALTSFFRTVRRNTNSNQVHVWLIQSHNLEPERIREIEHFALTAKCDFKITFGKASLKEDGTYHYPGGVLTLISMTHTKFTAYKEMDHTGHRCTIDWQGRHLEFANIYLPSKPIPRLQKIPELKNILTKTTLAAGD